MRAILKIKLTVLIFSTLLTAEGRPQAGWTIQNSGTIKNLNSVYFLSKNTGFIVGDSGTILKTTNGGNNWIVKNSGTYNSLRSVFFLNINRGYIAGMNGTYLISSDSGNTWSSVNIFSSETSNNFYSVLYTSAYNGYIAGDSILISTFDGGENWNFNYLINSLLSICFPNAATGYAIDDQGGIYRSEDGGINWRRKQIPLNISPSSVHFTGVQTGYITGASPNNIIKTSDGGTNWTVMHSGANRLNSIIFVNENKGFAGGDGGLILKTTNGGNAWYIQNSGTAEKINSVHFKDSLYGTAVGNNGLVITTVTGGEIPTYKLITGTVKYADNENIVSHGYVKAVKYDTTSSAIITIDSNIINPNGEYVLKIPLGDSTDIMAYQDDETADYVPTYYPSTIEWQQASTIIANDNRSNINIKVFRMDNSSLTNGYVAGRVFKTIIRLENNELPGSIIYAKTGNIFKGFSIADSTGRYKVELPIGNYKLFVNRYGYKNDSSSVYIQPPTLTYDSLNFYLQKHPSGIITNEGNIPVVFYLEQNYPNPFNPATIIGYSLGRGTFVKLTVYDINGKVIAIIENTEKPAGNYEVEFNSTDLPSGVYFYKIETEHFTAARPMVLLK